MKTHLKTTSQKIKVRACSIECIDHPEWGTFGVMEERKDYFEIHGRSGGRVLDKWEADKFWRVINQKSSLMPYNSIIQVCPTCGKVDAYKGDDHNCHAQLLKSDF